MSVFRPKGRSGTAIAALILVTLLLWGTPLAAQEPEEPAGVDNLVRVGAVGGVPEFLGVSVSATPMSYIVEFSASLPVITTDYRNQVIRLGVIPTLVPPGGSSHGFELRLPAMVGVRHQFNGDDMQPRCVTTPCPGVQENKWFYNAYVGIEASWSFDNRLDAFVETGGGYNFLFNAEDPDRALPGIPEARLMIGVGY